MAAGRGEFFRSFQASLEKKLTQPVLGRRQPVRGRGNPGPGGIQSGQTGGKTRKRQPSSVSGNSPSSPQPRPTGNKASSGSFHRSAVWHKIYTSEFGSRTWTPKSLAGDVEQKVDEAEGGGAAERSPGHWKKMYFRNLAGQEVNKWWRELRHDNSPYTGLPRQTERVLRYERESGSITSSSHFGSFSRPGWRSLIIKQDTKIHVCHIGKDKLVKANHSIAFIMASLHFHKLVEKSLLGSPVCPFSEPVEPPPADYSDPRFGLHGYTLHFVLHNTGAEIIDQFTSRTDWWS
ncbi:hypothetical protein FQN60_005627 [Etheostoma spectabile]|uniref:Uncharacterized protein n=1 Tax=Etheostoma spectabile TaxID=54343 RepID=A0A5J5CDY7_9PERO|nr:hypothetical protein FQN60_005627 [Etheostoma spectabile]